MEQSILYIMNNSIELRYLVGKDVEQWMEAKRKMTDEDLINMMKQFF